MGQSIKGDNIAQEGKTKEEIKANGFILMPLSKIKKALKDFQGRRIKRR